jgi:S1-C subfamily serine protease
MTWGPGSPSGKGVPITRTRSGTWLIGGAACLLVVVVVTAVGMVIVANGTAEQQSSETTLGLTSLTGTPTTDPGLGGMAASRAINTMVARVLPSTVALRIQSANGATSDVTGLVAESGGIIVTASAALVGARSVTAIEADGTREATDPVGIDPATGLAVVRIDDDLPAATFDADDPPVGGVAVAAALEPASHTHAGPASVYAGTVMSAGQAPTDPALANGFSATAVDAPLTRRDLGCALLDARGHVSGMLVTTEGTGRSTMGFFLPGQLVLDVTRQLVTSGKVENGWLGVASVTAAPTRAEVRGNPGDDLDQQRRPGDVRARRKPGRIGRTDRRRPHRRHRRRRHPFDGRDAIDALRRAARVVGVDHLRACRHHPDHLGRIGRPRSRRHRGRLLAVA